MIADLESFEIVTKIAFRSNRSGNYDIYTISTTGGTLNRITQDPGLDLDPDWSPDGNRIAFASDRQGGDYEIYSASSTGLETDVQRVTTGTSGSDNSPVYSPDGTK